MARREPLSIQPKYRSKLEVKIAQQLLDAGVPFEYEPRDRKVPYTIPSRPALYTLDFGVRGNPIIIEGKGWLKAPDRKKLVLIKEQHPELDIRIVFQNASNKIYKGSPTTYAKWATNHGFLFADKGVVPPEWVREMKG